MCMFLLFKKTMNWNLCSRFLLKFILLWVSNILRDYFPNNTQSCTINTVTVMNQFCFASSCTRSKKKTGKEPIRYIYMCVCVCVCACVCAMDVPIASYSAIDVNPVAIAKLFNKHRAILCDLVMSAYFESNPKWGIRVTK